MLRLNRRGQAAVGLCGDDGSLFQVKKRLLEGPDGKARDLGFVGAIEQVDVDVLNHIAEDYIPVVASVGADAQGQSYNVNADEAAGAVASALGAYKVIFLTDVRGWLADPGDDSSLDLGDDAPRRSGAGSARGACPVGCGRSSRPARTRSSRASGPRTSSTGGCRTRSCSSCSRMPESEPR